MDEKNACPQCGNPYMDTVSGICPNCGYKIKKVEEDSRENSVKETMENSSEDTGDIESPKADDAQVKNNNSAFEVIETDLGRRVLRVDKKLVVAVISAIVAVILIIAGIALYNHHKSIENITTPIELDLNNYVSTELVTDYTYDPNNYDSEGDDYFSNHGETPGLGIYQPYDSFAYLSNDSGMNIIDWNAFYSDLRKALQDKPGYEDLDVTTLIEEDCFSATVVSATGSIGSLKNGDTITVTITPKDATDGQSTFKSDEITLNVKAASATYTVANLESAVVLDPFNYAAITFSGANGAGRASIWIDQNLNQATGIADVMAVYYDDHTVSLQRNGYIIAKISYEIWTGDGVDFDALKNGDALYLKSSIESTTDWDNLVSSENVRIPSDEKDYPVNGLGDYIDANFNISYDDYHRFAVAAEEYLMERCGTTDYDMVNTNVIYLVDQKDKTQADNDGVYNYYFIVFNQPDEYSDIPQYAYVIYKNLVAKDGAIVGNPSDYEIEDWDTYYENPDNILNTNYWNLREVYRK